MRYAAFGMVDPIPEERDALWFVVLNLSGPLLFYLGVASLTAAALVGLVSAMAGRR